MSKERIENTTKIVADILVGIVGDRELSIEESIEAIDRVSDLCADTKEKLREADLKRVANSATGLSLEDAVRAFIDCPHPVEHRSTFVTSRDRYRAETCEECGCRKDNESTGLWERPHSRVETLAYVLKSLSITNTRAR